MAEGGDGQREYIIESTTDATEFIVETAFAGVLAKDCQSWVRDCGINNTDCDVYFHMIWL